MQHGAAMPVDGARILLLERHDIVRPARRVLDIEMGERLPAAPQAEHLDAVVGRAISHALDDSVEARNVTAAGQNSNALTCHGAYLSWRLLVLACKSAPSPTNAPDNETRP